MYMPVVLPHSFKKKKTDCIIIAALLRDTNSRNGSRPTMYMPVVLPHSFKKKKKKLSFWWNDFFFFFFFLNSESSVYGTKPLARAMVGVLYTEQRPKGEGKWCKNNFI